MWLPDCITSEPQNLSQYIKKANYIEKKQRDPLD